MRECNRELIEAGWQGEHYMEKCTVKYTHPSRDVTVPIPEEQALKVERRYRNHAASNLDESLAQGFRNFGETLARAAGANISGQPVRERIYAAINEERSRQSELWGDQWETEGMPPENKLAILVEEVGEVAKEMQEMGQEHPVTRKELVQVAAVCIAWLESLPEWEGEHG